MFRPAKRRKFVRHHEREPSPSTEQGSESQGDVEATAETSQGVDLASIIRARKQNKTRGGVSFANTKNAHQDRTDDSTALVKPDSADRLKDMKNRFVGSTGQIVDVDENMCV